MRSLIILLSTTHAGIENFFLRVVTGVIFIGHGGQKLFGLFGGGGLEQVSLGFEKIGIPYPEINAVLVGCTEFFGGVALLVGFLVRLASIPMGITMAVAVFFVHWNNGLFSKQGGFEYPLTLLAVFVLFFFSGAGPFSIDRGIYRSLR